MKYLSLFCIAVIGLYSCTRSNSTPNPPSPPVTQDSAFVLASMVTDQQINAPDKRTYSYGADGKLTGQSDTSFFDTISWKYIYNGSAIYINSTKGENDTIELNSHGYVTKFIENEDTSDNFINTSIYTYTDDTLLTNWKFSQKSSNITFDVNYFFDNGDVVRSEDSSGTTNYDYYENMLIVEPDVNSRIIQPSSAGMYVIRNRHLIKSWSNAYPSQTTNYAYTLDSNGRVLTETESRGGGTIKYTYTYAHIPVKLN